MSSKNTNTQKDIGWVKLIVFGFIGAINFLGEYLLNRVRPLAQLVGKGVDLYIKKVHGIGLAATVFGFELFKLYLKFGLLYSIKKADLSWVLQSSAVILAWMIALLLGAVSLQIIFKGKEKIEKHWIGRVLLWLLTPIFWIKDNAKAAIKFIKASYVYRLITIQGKRLIKLTWRRVTTRW